MKICIDAGHNFSGWNTGAEGNGLREQDIAWQIAERLRIQLERVGVDVLMTRPAMTTNLGTNNSTAIKARYTLANSNNCVLFISVHCNSFDNETANGTEVLVYELGSEAAKLAQLMQNNIVAKLGTADRGVKARPALDVLEYTKMPAVLVETAFISNENDAYKLLHRQEEFAEAIYEAVCEYCGIKREPESARTRAERIIRAKCDTPDMWLAMLDTVPWFAEFVCKIAE